MAKKKQSVDIAKGFASSQKNRSSTMSKNLELKRKKEKEDRKRKEEKEKERVDNLKKQEELEKQQKLQKIEKEYFDKSLKSFKIRIATLSPVHIGDGTEYEPTNYVIRDNYLYSFNEYFVLEKLQEVENINGSKLSDLSALVAFLRGKADFIIDNNLYKNTIGVANDIARLYKKDFGISNNNDESINQMLINKNISTINPQNNKLEPYIPGSSIKGAIQTVLNLSVEESQRLKISDSVGVKVQNQIAWSLRKTSKGSIPQKLEIISSNSNFNFIFTKANSLTFDTIIEKIHNFYKEADNEQFIRYERNIRNKETQFLLRVGRYCGNNFTSINSKEKPKTKSLFRKEEHNEQSELPFGWILCEIIK
jgi:CRISPR/Cas system CSM-associated protein Csm5 (group 7 of RAMP superfamily)